MECPAGGELLTLEDGQVTSREIRQLEQHVIDVAGTAAGREPDGIAVGHAERDDGLHAAEAVLGEGKQLDPEQRRAFDLLISGPGWVCLTGRAGTGKGPVLHAAAEAYRAAGWRVIACAMDGTTARRMAEQLGGTVAALTVEQLKVRLDLGTVQVDDRTVIFVDEASKLETGHWADLAKAVHDHRPSVRAVGHDGQHDAIRLPGLFSEMLTDNRIPTAELRQIRRHRHPENPVEVHPWLRDYQIAVDQGRGLDAVAILQAQHALHLHDTRAQAIGGIVEEWDQWRHGHQPTKSMLIVHGPNSDVDLVNELAQRKRLDAGELGKQTIRAVDRDYLLRPGDVVSIRSAAYTFPARPGHPRPKRIENGQIAIVESVDPERDALTLLLREPGAETRLVEVDQARLRAEHAAGKLAAAIRLNYAVHSFPAQGATVDGTATLAGHWSQARQETYVGDTRAIYRHTVHVAREDLGIDGTDKDRIGRYARRISHSRQRHASIRQTLDQTRQLAVDLPERQALPGTPDITTTQDHNALAPSASSTTRDTSQSTAPQAASDMSGGASAGNDPCGPPHTDRRERLDRVLADPPEHLICALGPVPEEPVARERWAREAKRLQALHRPGAAQPAFAPPSSPSNELAGPRPSALIPAAQQRDAPAIRR